MLLMRRTALDLLPVYWHKQFWAPWRLFASRRKIWRPSFVFLFRQSSTYSLTSHVWGQVTLFTWAVKHSWESLRMICIIMHRIQIWLKLSLVNNDKRTETFALFTGQILKDCQNIKPNPTCKEYYFWGSVRLSKVSVRLLQLINCKFLAAISDREAIGTIFLD